MVELFNIRTKEGLAEGRSMIFSTIEEAVRAADAAGYTDYLVYDMGCGRLIDWNEIHVEEPEFEYYSEEDQAWHRIIPGVFEPDMSLALGA